MELGIMIVVCLIFAGVSFMIWINHKNNLKNADAINSLRLELSNGISLLKKEIQQVNTAVIQKAEFSEQIIISTVNSAQSNIQKSCLQISNALESSTGLTIREFKDAQSNILTSIDSTKVAISKAIEESKKTIDGSLNQSMQSVENNISQSMHSIDQTEKEILNQVKIKYDSIIAEIKAPLSLD